MKILSLGVELPYADTQSDRQTDGQTDRQDEANRSFWNFAKAPESNMTLGKYAELKHGSKVRHFIKYSNVSMFVSGRVNCT